MSSPDYVSIATDQPLDLVASTLSTDAVATGESYQFQAGDALVEVYAIDLVEDNGVDWSRFAFEVAVDAEDCDVQERVARDLYDRLVAVTDWALVLSFDEGLGIRAARPALEPA
jgi:hypothetical protein